MYGNRGKQALAQDSQLAQTLVSIDPKVIRASCNSFEDALGCTRQRVLQEHPIGKGLSMHCFVLYSCTLQALADFLIFSVYLIGAFFYYQYRLDVRDYVKDFRVCTHTIAAHKKLICPQNILLNFVNFTPINATCFWGCWRWRRQFLPNSWLFARWFGRRWCSV